MGVFEDTIAAVLAQYPAGVYLAAVSGGADSTAMLAALAAIRDSGVAFNLRCIHIEHGIRPAAESRGDAAFVRSLCEKFHVPCRVVAIAPGRIAAIAQERGMGIEAAARRYRRRAWFRSAQRLEAEGSGQTRVLTAHTADDALETVLMRILRGAGPSGLAAMPVSRGLILRPLLTLSRRDVIEYLREKNIAWREDSTNSDTLFLRNRIRHCLIPLLSEQFPQWQGGVAAFAQTQALVKDFIQSEAASRVRWRLGIREQGLGTDADAFFAQPPIIREEALFQAIDRLLQSCRVSRTIKRKNIRRFCEGNSIAIDLGPLRITKDSRHILISPLADPRSPAPSPYFSETGSSRLYKAID